MKLGLTVGYSGAQMRLPMDLILEAERCGFHSVWTAEAWGSDAVSPAAWIAAKTTTINVGTAIMQIPGRTPANAAMTAMTLDALSGGRFIMGLGTSGPQVVEGWHGQSFRKSLTWIKEYVEIIRIILAREEKLTFQGERFRIPYDGPGSMGQGKPLKSILHGNPNIPIFAGSMAPKSQAWSAEKTDGCLLTCMHPGKSEVLEARFATGLARAGKDRSAFTLAPTVPCAVGPDLDACRNVFRPQLALYIGGMGSRKKNFYKDYISEVGYAGEAQEIQDLFLDGKKREAIAAVPDALIDEMYLVGPPEHIRDQLDVWRESSCDLMVLGTTQPEAVRLLADALL